MNHPIAAHDISQSTSAEPSNPLTIASSSPPHDVHDAPPNRFILFTNDWLDLQSYVQQSLALPITTNDFAATYGDFASTDTALIAGAVDALKKVNGLSATFGDPRTLKQRLASDANYLNGASAPTEIYGHIVWLAGQISNAASTFNFTLPALLTLLGQGSKEDRTKNLKSILIGPGGLVSTADDMRVKTAALVQKLANFDGNLTDANKQLQTFIGKESDLMSRTDQLIGSLQHDIDDVLQPSADDAYRKWRDYTISAVTTSVGVTVLSGGLLLPVAAGLAIGLGTAAALEKKAYNDLMDKIASERVDIQKKSQLKTDLSGFNARVNLVGPALTTFKSSLESVEGVFTQMSMNLAFVANNFGEDKLSDLPWVTQALKIGDATNKWHAIGDTAQEFTQSSLVSYDSSTRFGAKVPDAAAHGLALHGGASPSRVARLRRRH